MINEDLSEIISHISDEHPTKISEVIKEFQISRRNIILTVTILKSLSPKSMSPYEFTLKAFDVFTREQKRIKINEHFLGNASSISNAIKQADEVLTEIMSKRK